MIEETRLVAARRELARVRGEVADLKAEAQTWRETVSELEARALEVGKEVADAEERKRIILAACADLPAAIQSAINNVLMNFSEK